jgi:hypothetical protein
MTILPATLAPAHATFVRALRLPFAVAAGYILAVPGVMRLLGVAEYHAWWFDWWMLVNYHLLIGLIVGVIRASDGRLGDFLRHRAPAALGAGLVFILFFTAFTSWKHGFWRWGWFGWDTAFARLDRALHFGRFPHEWLAPLTRFPLVLMAFDWLYLLWGVVMISTLSAVLWAAPIARCRQYLLTFLAAWILLGTILAPVFGSAGPVYYARVTQGPDPYVHLREQLKGLHAAEIQEWLWNTTNTPVFIPVTGISAMPSLHIAQATLVALLAWTSRWWVFRALGVAFLIGMQLATVAIGWHYAVDGYVAAALTWGLWHLAKPPTSDDAISEGG